MTALLVAELVSRFARDFEAALQRAVAPDDLLALAVSGGPDSMAMLALAHAAFPGQVIAATVDHGLRHEGADEAAMVGAWCAANAIPHASLMLPRKLGKSGVQANARAARYDVLVRWAIDASATLVATAHHADDQAETFLMRAVRGTGPAGLAGIRAKRALVVTDHLPGFPQGGVVAVHDQWSIPLLRPLLGWRREELRSVALVAGLPFVDDPGNVDRSYERVRVRELLAATPWLDAQQIARSAAHAAEAAGALAEFAAWLWSTRKVLPLGIDDPDGQCWIDMTGLPRELKRRLIRIALDQVRLTGGITRPRFDESGNVEALIDALEAGKSATRAGVMASAKGDIWRFYEAPARRTH